MSRDPAGVNHSNIPSYIREDVAEQYRHELILLGDGEKKVTMTVDTRVANTVIFTFNKEDHTLGNMIRARLLKDKRVTFAGYKVEHPLLPKFELRVGTDGEITPKDALIKACKDLVQDLAILSREFTKEWELKKIAGNDAET
ncbi:MAG: DNA-directed RNA polymerase II core subunit [Bogoriella megaspora]|nr:MAG: DNA-directed RNA polymerase II core subunit [Bogoriella megaspora]